MIIPLSRLGRTAYHAIKSPITRPALAAALIGCLVAGPAQAHERTARLVPQVRSSLEVPAMEKLLRENETGENDTLEVASDMYSLWASQLALVITADESPRAWQQFMGLGPNITQAYKQLGLTAWEKNELQEAVRLLEKAHALDPQDSEIIRKLGYAYKETGRYEKAVDMLFLATIELPNDHLVWLWLGDAQRLLGQYTDAYESMLMARDLAPSDQSEDLQSFVDYTLRLGEQTPSWDNFETHRNFAARHLTSRRIRQYIAEFVRALEVAPAGEMTTDTTQRLAFSNQEIGIQYSYLKEHDVAIDYYERAAQLYEASGDVLDVARNRNNIADAYMFLTDREWLDTAVLQERSLENRREALSRAQQVGDVEFVRYVQGRLLNDLLKVHPHTAAEVQEARNRNLRELPRTGPVTDYSLAAVADGEIAYRLAEGDLAGARILIDMVLPYYEQSQYLEDSERATAHYVQLAHIYQQQEHYQEAERQAEKAMTLLASIRDLMVPDAFSRSRVLDTYRHASTALARAALAMDEPLKALTYFERYAYQIRQDMLGSKIGGEAAFNEYATERDLLPKRLDNLNEALEAARAQRDEDSVARLEERIAADTSRLEWLDRDIAFLSAKEVDFELPPMLEGEDLTEIWPADITLAAYLYDAYGAVALVLDNEAVRGVILPEATEQALRKHVSAFRAALAEASAADAPLATLSTLLVAPLQDALNDKIVYFATSDLLHELPYEALTAGESALVEQHAVAYAPSANYLLFATDQEPGDAESVIIFDTGETAATSQAVATAVPEAELVTGADATETRLRNLDTSYRWAHIASDADVLHSDVMLNALELGADDQNDGLVHAAELLAFTLPVSLVSLDLQYATEAQDTSGMRLSGFVDGFFHAGVPSLVLNQWSVEADATAFFVDAFYTNLLSMEKLAAFHEAQRATRAQYPAVAQWAAFTFRGDYR